MNEDISNHEIAKAQGHFAKLADEIKIICQNPNDVDRVVLRGVVSDREKTLSQTAKYVLVGYARGNADFKASDDYYLYSLSERNHPHLTDLVSKFIP